VTAIVKRETCRGSSLIRLHKRGLHQVGSVVPQGVHRCLPRTEVDVSTPEPQQDPDEHGYGGTHQEKRDDDRQEHPLEDPEPDSRQDYDGDDDN